MGKIFTLKPTTNQSLQFLLVLISCLAFNLTAYSEGSKELLPNNASDGYFALYPDYNNFASYAASPEERLHITICNPGEVIYYGVHSNDDFGRKWRLKDPLGNIVVGESDIPWYGDVGHIDSYGEAVAGPSQIVGATGYNAISYTTLMAGDYYLEFYRDGQRTMLQYLDITVADAPNGNAIDGRVWSKEWCLTVESYTNRFEATLFMYSNDMITTGLDFNGIQPYVFTITANATGVESTGNFTEDRKSVFGNQQYPSYRIFLNPPDINCFPTGEFGTLTQESNITGCGEIKCINIYSDKPGFVLILLNFNGIPGYQPNTEDIQLAQDVIGGVNCIQWDSRDGFGDLVDDDRIFELQVDYLNGITHLPMMDVEQHSLGYSVSLVRPTGGTPLLFWDDSNLGNGIELAGSPNPSHTWFWGATSYEGGVGNNNTINTWWYANIHKDTVDVQIQSLDVDANVNIPGKGANNGITRCKESGVFDLFGEVVGAPAGQWTTSGTGVFSGSGTIQQGTYTPSAADYASGSIVLTLTSTGGVCATMSDFMVVDFTDNPTMDIGPPQTVCENDPDVNLVANFTESGGMEWTGGTGTFVPNRFTATAVYTPSAAEITAGTVTLTANTTGNGICNPTSDDLVITIEQAPNVDAGAAGGPQSICDNNTLIQLAGSFSNASQVTWSGAGTFSDVNSPTSTYQPTNAEVASGSFTLTLTTDAPGMCLPESDQIVFNVSSGPTVDAGAPILGCTNNDTIQLAGSFTVASGVEWTSNGTGSFIPNTTTANARYVLSIADQANANFKLFLETTGNGICLPEKDSLVVTIQPAPVVTISSTDQTICANNPVVNATVNVVGSAGGTWSGGSGSFVPNTTSSSVTYIPSAGEITANFASIFFTATDLEGCTTVKDTLEIIILPAPIVLAGPDQDICKNNPDIALNGTVILADASEWIGTGGAFTSAVTNPVNGYQPNAGDLAGGTIDLILKATKDKCNPVFDTLTVTFTPEPTLVPGPDQTVCANNPEVSLSSVITVATGVQWSGGSNNFANSTALNTTYTPSAGEISSGSAQVTVTTTDNDNCLPVSATVDISITPAPTVGAGNDVTVCTNNALATVTGTLTVATQAIWSGGNGNYQDNENDLTLLYAPSDAEKTAGTVTLTLTTTDNGDCLPVTDDMVITFTPNPTVVFPDQSICGDGNADYTVTLTVASGVIVSGGNGTFNPNNTSTTFTYTPSASEILAGTANLTATTTGNGDCNAVNDPSTLTIQAIPTINAGSDAVLCTDVTSTTLNGSFTNLTTVHWTTSGSGTFANNNNAVTTYTPSATDITNGTATLTLTGDATGLCNEVTDEMVLTFTPATSITAGADQTVCSNSFPVLLGAIGSPGTWSGGNGTFVPGTNTLNPQYTPTAGELANGTVTLTITTQASGACPAVSDDIVLTLLEGPVANAGPDQTVCSNTNINLNASVTNAGGGFWTTNGTGNFSGTTNLTGTYTPSTNDINPTASTTVELYLSTTGTEPCPIATDTVIMTLDPTPVINAGPDQTICANQTHTLSGSFTITSGITWSGGTGSFSNVNQTDAVYTPSGAETTAGSVTLTLTGNPLASCPAIPDEMILSFLPEPTVNAGSDLTLCADTAFVTVTGTVTNATDGLWFSSGDGVFSLTNAGLTTNYYPSANDTTNGSVKLWMETMGSGMCATIADTLTLTFTPTPSINAGPDQTLCADMVSIALTGTLTNVTQGIWTANGTGTFADANSTNTTYTPSVADKLLNTLLFTFTTVDHGLCKEYDDQMTVHITPPPTLDAGFPQDVCADLAEVQLNATLTVAGGVEWTTSGTGTFTPNTTDLNAKYLPSVADTTAGSVQLFASTTQNGLCKAVKDTVLIEFTPVAIVTAGADHTVCADTSSIQLTSVSQNVTGLNWTTNGSGNFFTSPFQDTVQYVPSSADTTARTVEIYLASEPSVCSSVVDTLTIDIIPVPFLTITPDLTVCADSTGIALGSTVTNATGLAWTTSGTGTISDTTLLNPIYAPSSIDTLAGRVRLTITSVGNGLCKAVSESMDIDFEKLPTIYAGPDATACAMNAGVVLNGQIANANGGFWTSTGTGTFGPDTLTLGATYFPSVADTISKSMDLVLTTITNGVCKNITDTLHIQIQPLPTANAGDDINMCADASTIQLNGSVTNALTGQWSLMNGTGVLSDPNDLNAFYSPSALDTTNKTVSFILSTVGNGECAIAQDTVVLTIAPEVTVNAGNDITDCADSEFTDLLGTSANATTTTWTTSGGGTFTDANILDPRYLSGGNDYLLNQITFTLTATDEVNGCQPKSDNFTMTLTPIPTINAGEDLEACIGIASVPLGGVFTHATGGRWKMVNGVTGSFSPNPDQINVDYIPSATDFANGSVLLQLYTTGHGNCLTYNDSLLITFSPTPPISAGADATVCNTDIPYQLQGSGSSGTWTGGLGIFTPNNTTSNALYQPTPAELTAGTVTLTRTTFNNGTCAIDTDNVTLTFINGPTVDAGADITACSNEPVLLLNGNSTVAGGVQWTTTGTGTFDVVTNTTTNYNPSATDITSGTVLLNLTTTGNGVCDAQTDEVVVSFITAPTADAGADRTVCIDNPTLTLDGAFTNATNATWSGGTIGNYSDVTSMTSTYTASPGESTAGAVTLTLTTSGHPNCAPATDDMLLTILPLPIITINNDSTVCEDGLIFELDAEIVNALAGRWSTTGSGVFSPSDTSLVAIYVPSNADRTAMSVVITLSTEGNGLCNVVSQSFTLTFQPVTKVLTVTSSQLDACENETNIAITSTIIDAGGVLWTTAGSGTFGDALSENTTYNPSPADLIKKSVILIANTTNNGECDTARATLAIDFAPLPDVRAGFDFDVCANTTGLQLNGFFTEARKATWATFNGGGTFTPTDSTMTGIYLPTPADTVQGFVDITLTTSPTICPIQVDTMHVNLVPLPLVNVPDTLDICTDTTALAITGIVTNAPGGVWTTSGTGTFSTSPNDLNGTYVMSADDYNAEFIGLTLTNTGNNLCPKASDALIIEISKEPNLFIDDAVPACINVTDISLNATAENQTSVLWSTVTGGTFTDNTQLATLYQPSNQDRTNGYIDLKITANGVKTCKPKERLVKVNLQQLPIINAGPDKNYCANNAIGLYNGQINYGGSVWTTTGEGRFEVAITDLQVTYFPSSSDTAGSTLTLYLNSIDDGICPSVYDSLNITFVPQPYLMPSKGILCNIIDGVTIAVGINNGNPGTWTTTGTGTFSPSSASYTPRYFPTQADFDQGTIEVTFATDLSMGCNVVTSTMQVVLQAEPISNAGIDVHTCRDNNVTLSATIEEDVVYDWETTTGTNLGSGPSINVTAPNDLTIVMTATDDRGCEVKDTVEVGVWDLPLFNLPTPVCYNDTLVLDANPANIPNVPGSFQWYKNSVLQAGQNTSKYYLADKGTYTISYAYQDCSTEASSLVNPLPIITTTDELSCEGDLVNISTTELVSSTYLWSDGTSNQGTGFTIPIITVVDTNTYYVTVTDINGCFAVDSLDVIGIPKPLMGLKDTSACIGETIVLSSAPSNYTDFGIYSPVYSWFNGTTNINNTTDEIAVTTDGLYIGKIGVGQCAVSDTAKVVFNPLPISTLPDGELIYCEDDVDGIVLNAGVATEYFWTPSGDITQTTLANEEQMYHVTLTNQFGCVISDNVYVKMVCPPELHVPTAFTPGINNGDQYFRAFTKHVVEFDLTIYNRWGEVIFHTNDINEGWNGEYRDEEMLIGTYPWVIRYKGRGEYSKTKVKEGRVTLLR